MKHSYLYIIVFVLLLILSIYYIGIQEAGSILHSLYPDAEQKLESLGLLGDSTGLLNSLFSSLAFGAVIISLYWQINENRKQQKDNHIQQFENVFFSMTNTLEQIVSGLKEKQYFASVQNVWDEEYNSDYVEKEIVEDKQRIIEYKGREVFQYIYESKTIDGKTLRQSIEEGGIEGYNAFMNGRLDHYFRYLYRILRYIDDSTLIDDNKKYDYSCILRAQLSNFELLILYYNCLSDYGIEKMKPLVEKYSVLSNIREDSLVGEERNSTIKDFPNDKLYDETAFEHCYKIFNKDVLGTFLWNLSWTVLAAVVFCCLLSHVWNSIIVRHLLSVIPRNSVGVIAVLVAIDIYITKSTISKKKELLAEYESQKKHKIISSSDFFKFSLQDNYLIPISLFLLVTTIYSSFTHDYEWYSWHGMSYIWFVWLPLVADVFLCMFLFVHRRNTR